MAVLVATVVVVGGIGYAVLNSTPAHQSRSPPPACVPPGSVYCGTASPANDVILSVSQNPAPGAAWAKVVTGQSLTATVSLETGDSGGPSEFSVSWGDGNITNGTGPTFEHRYGGPGTYVVSATAQENGVQHTGTNDLYPVIVAPATPGNGTLPVLTTTFSNGSLASATPSAPWIHSGQEVTVSAAYVSLPTVAGYSVRPPTLSTSGGNQVSQVSVTNSSTSIEATYRFASAGVYEIRMTGAVSSPHGTEFLTYGWTVYVAATSIPLGCSYCRTNYSSPHPGSLYIYEIVPGGPTSLDPAIDYYSTGAEILQNVYETLVQYNGSSTASFVPVLSTCVPGPAASGPTSCQAVYGSDLVVNNQYWTFPIDKNAQFYDPSTSARWGVYPSDVMFSIARTLLWLESPSQYTYPGWILGQSLLPYGNRSWDSGLHAPWNNTPRDLFSSMLVNDSAYCPPSALTNEHGCITFNVDGSASRWPYFLDFVADVEGGGIVPCGWFSQVGAGVPGFEETKAANGDGPCLLPGGTTSTNTTAFSNAVAAMSPTAFDSLIQLGGTQVYEPQPQVRWNVVGSGPYYLVSVNSGQGYILKQNPDYAQPQCAGQTGCFPALGGYAANVYVFWDPDSEIGIQQYVAGRSDSSAFLPGDLPTIESLAQDGRVGVQRLPTLNVFPEGFSLIFNPSLAQSYSGLTTNVPGDFFAYVGMRELFAQSFPYAAYYNDYSAVEGTPTYSGEGGAIPQYLGNYYPQNITWPGMNTSVGQWPQVWSDPSTASDCASVVGSACWWWANITTVGSPYYDPEAVACKTTTCRLPLVSEYGDTSFDLAVDTWGADLVNITSGAIVTSRWDPTPYFGFPGCYFTLGIQPGCSPTYLDGWIADYPDPTDFSVPFYLPDQSYTYVSAINETLVGGDYGTSYDGCPSHGSLAWEQNNFADLAYWANYGNLVPESCQGNAYSTMVWGLVQADVMPVGPTRVLYYNMIEHIANDLVLYVYTGQQVGLTSYAGWVDPSTVDLNPVSPGQLWFEWNGNGVVS